MFVPCFRVLAGENRAARAQLPRPPALRLRVLVGLVLVALTLSACQDNGEVVTAPTTPEALTPPETSASAEPSTIAPSTPQEALAEPVLAAYRGYWDAWLAANDPPDESLPALRQYATGEAYRTVFDAVQANRLGGRAIRLPEGSVSRRDVEVVSMSADRATVRDCSVDDAVVVGVDTGEVLDDDVVTRLSTGELVLEDGSWRVSTTRIEQTWEGVAGCAVE